MAQKPITAIRLGSDDKNTAMTIRKMYNLTTFADSVRLAIRVLSDLELPVEQVQEIAGRYAESNPEELVITFNGEKE